MPGAAKPRISKHEISKDEGIVRQVAIKVAVQIAITDPHFALESPETRILTVLEIAENLEKWVWR